MSEQDVNRRSLIEAVGAAAATTSLSGCAGMLEEDCRTDDRFRVHEVYGGGYINQTGEAGDPTQVDISRLYGDDEGCGRMADIDIQSEDNEYSLTVEEEGTYNIDGIGELRVENIVITDESDNLGFVEFSTKEEVTYCSPRL